jgi:DNA polymerase-1
LSRLDDLVFVCADYGQIEVRVAAYASHDPKLLAIMQRNPETADGDVHSQNVSKLFGIPFEDQKGYKHLRTRAKNYFFGALYGSGGWEVQEVIEKQFLQDPELLAHGVPTLREIQAGIRDLRDEYAHYFSEWVPYEIWNAKEHGNTVFTLFGRPRIIPDLTSQDKRDREAAEREAISHIVQGSSADVLRMATIKVADIPNGRLVLTVHDELGSIVEEGLAVEYKEAMVDTMLLGQPFEDVPLVVDAEIGRTWYDCHK